MNPTSELIMAIMLSLHNRIIAEVIALSKDIIVEHRLSLWSLLFCIPHQILAKGVACTLVHNIHTNVIFPPPTLCSDGAVYSFLSVLLGLYKQQRHKNVGY